MNQWQIWTVVKPTVGLPLLLGSVAGTSLLLHYAILSHTSWYPAYWEGGHKHMAEASGAAITAAQTPPAFTVSVAPAAAAGDKGGSSFVVTVTPTGSAAASAPVTIGDASAPPPLKSSQN